MSPSARLSLGLIAVAVLPTLSVGCVCGPKMIDPCTGRVLNPLPILDLRAVAAVPPLLGPAGYGCGMPIGCAPVGCVEPLCVAPLPAAPTCAPMAASCPPSPACAAPACAAPIAMPPACGFPDGCVRLDRGPELQPVASGPYKVPAAPAAVASQGVTDVVPAAFADSGSHGPVDFGFDRF
ncbi:MAG: hypothetical protein AAF532_01585 [Planctomycetota bacterium]